MEGNVSFSVSFKEKTQSNSIFLASVTFPFMKCYTAFP